MKINEYLSLLILIVFSIAGCKKEDDGCPYIIDGSIRSMYAPDSAQVNSIIRIGVNYDSRFDCEQFHSIKSITDANLTTVWVQSEIDACDCKCDNEIYFPRYDFKAPSTPGIATVKVHVIDSIYYTATIVIY